MRCVVPQINQERDDVDEITAGAAIGEFVFLCVFTPRPLLDVSLVLLSFCVSVSVFVCTAPACLRDRVLFSLTAFWSVFVLLSLSPMRWRRPVPGGGDQGAVD